MGNKHYLVGFKDLEHAQKASSVISGHGIDVVTAESFVMCNLPKNHGFCRRTPSYPLEMRLDIAKILEDADVLVVYGMSKDASPIKELIKLTEVMGIRTVYVGEDIRSRYQTPLFGPFKIRWDNVICFHQELMKDIPLSMLNSHLYDATQKVIQTFNDGMLPTSYYSTWGDECRYCVSRHAMLITYSGAERESDVTRVVKKIIAAFKENPRKPNLPSIEIHLVPLIPGKE